MSVYDERVKKYVDAYIKQHGKLPTQKEVRKNCTGTDKKLGETFSRLRREPEYAVYDTQSKYSDTTDYSYEEDGETARVSLITEKRVINEADLIEVANIDMEIWEIDRFRINKWEAGRKARAIDMTYTNGVANGTVKDSGGWNITPLFKVEIWLKKRVDVVELRKLKQELLNDIKSVVKPPPKPRYKLKKHTHMIELDLPDAHIDKRPFNGTYTLEQMEADILERTTDLLEQTAHYPTELITIIGANDFLNSEINSSTKKGTHQDNLMNQRDAFRFGVRIKRKVINLAREVAPVRLIMPLGNHSPESEFHMGEVLAAIYEDDKSVTIDNDIMPHKYFRYGASSFMYIHKPEAGGLNALPVVAGSQFPEFFGEGVLYRFIKLGHFHKKNIKILNTTNEDFGVRFEFLRALSVADEWHTERLYQSVRGAEARVYGFECGPRATFESFV